MRKLGLVTIFFAVLSIVSASYAAPEIKVVGLFKDQAVVRLGNQLQTIKLRQLNEFGMYLNSLGEQSAEITYEGLTKVYAIRRDYSGGYKVRTQARATVSLNNNFQYITAGSVNGRMLEFLLDTGANSVAMSSRQARRLGINFKSREREVSVSTAQGDVRAWQVILERIKVGEIELQQVAAVVIDGAYPVYTLLGMSFLSRVTMSNKQGVVTLVQNF